jgi:twitching motility protein PilJ
MSLKDFFSQKQKKAKPKSTKIGGNNSEDLLSSATEDLFDDEAFKKEDSQDDISQRLNHESTTKENISLKTDATDMSVFTNKFENIDDFENQLNNMSPIKDDGNLGSLSFEIEEDKKLNISKEDDFDLGTSVLDFELEKSELQNNLKTKSDEKIIFTENDKSVDESTLMALYEEDAKEKSTSLNKKDEPIKDNEDLLQEQIKEIDTLYSGGALAQEQEKEEVQERLDVVTAAFSAPSERITLDRVTLSEDAEELAVPTRSGSKNHLNKLGHLDAALDLQTVSPDDILGSSFESKSSAAPKKRYKSTKKEHYKKSIFGNVSPKTQYTMFFSTLFIGVIGLGGSVFFSYDSNNKESHASKLTATIGGETEQFHSSFRESLIGVTGSYKKMSETWDTILNLSKVLRGSVVSLQNPKINEVFNRITQNIESVSKNVEYVKGLESIVKDASAKKEAIDEKVLNLVNLVDRVSLIYMQTGATQAEISQLSLIKSSLKNINGSVSTILVGESVNQSSVVELNSTKDLIQNSMSELLNGSAAKGINKMPTVAMPAYNKFVTDWKYLSGELDDILKNADSLTKAKSIAKSNNVALNNLVSDIKSLSDLYDGNAHGFSPLFKKILIASILLLIISLVGLGYVYRFESEKKERELKAEADRNKKSVNKLLNEMVYLQTGNLTKKTTVEEGITLDIADSINATIDSLVVVVTKIKNSSLVMKQKTNEINLVSTKLLDATEKQSDSIVEANESINNIAKAIHQISEKTKESLVTAQQSAEASNLGARQVKESIESMNAISKNMEETVVLMKKVSDSSKQISEVINLLSDITEETNILALNATVQAAKAGEAGKGFKVVADSIQELADNAAEATRRVGALIATVQTDIQSVGSSIERTNKEVERGVELSENAGTSLNEITEISNQLAEIVKSISRDANTNAEAARQISYNMSTILKTTEETKDSTKKTTNSIAEIDKMSSELSESVKTFIVP